MMVVGCELRRRPPLATVATPSTVPAPRYCRTPETRDTEGLRHHSESVLLQVLYYSLSSDGSVPEKSRKISKATSTRLYYNPRLLL